MPASEPALYGLDLFGDPILPPSRGKMADEFLVPPFSVLNAREGWWQNRKRAWIAQGIKSELGRGANTLGLSQACEEYRTGEGDYSKCGAVEPTGAGFAAGLLARHEAAKRPPRAEVFGTGGPGDVQRGWKRSPNSLANRVERATEGDSDARIAGVVMDEEGNGTGTSIFDPVLCELAYRWFCPARGLVLDPFAGGSVRGIVAALLGRKYWGCDLRAEQVAANEQQAARICPENPPAWRCGDAAEVLAEAPAADFLLTCPPYGDLERYSDDPRDLSTMDYPQFRDALARVIAAACARLKPGRFACIVVGDFRDKRGHYRNFVSDTIGAFGAAGLPLYNEAILITQIGSLPVRVGKQWAASRKLGKTHQNVLVFVKGDWREAARAATAGTT